MHQCDYCCWYVNDARGCECPWAMRDKACKSAQEKALAAQPIKKQSEKKTDERTESAVVRSEESKQLKDIVCNKCNKKYRAKTKRDYNSVGMWIEYAHCPDCGAQNLTSWHVW